MRYSLLIIFSIIAYTVTSQELTESNIIVIANSIEQDNITKKELKEIFLGTADSWKNNSNVLIVLPSSKYPQKNRLTEIVMGRTHDGVRRYWLSLVFQGRANPPIYLDNNDEIINYVKQNKGSIAVMLDCNTNVNDMLIKIID